MSHVQEHFAKVFLYTKRGIIVIAAIWAAITIIKPLVHSHVTVDRSLYTVKEGFPLFTSGKAYISLLKSYPKNPGVKLDFYTIHRGESYWDIAYRNGITIDTIIAANPFIATLVASEGTEIVIPADDGILFACDNFFDAWRMGKLTDSEADLSGEYIPGPFDLLSADDIRFAFIRHARPVVVNQHLDGLFEIKKNYNVPCAGRIVSMYGERSDPILHTPSFHEGIDIVSPTGTPVRPIRGGMILATGWREGYGNCITIMHPDGFQSLYGHLSEIRVSSGTMVTKDDVIGLIGSTGRSTGPHLHFQMFRHGELMNPLYFIW